MNTNKVQPHTPRPQPVGQDKRCKTCGNITRQALPGDTCVWGSSQPSELMNDMSAQCGGELENL